MHVDLPEFCTHGTSQMRWPETLADMRAVCFSSAHAPMFHQTSLTYQKFKDKII